MKNKIIGTPYIIRTSALCELLRKSRMTLYAWEKKGIFTPPRDMRGDRVFTEKQVKEIIKAFSPGGKMEWHFRPRRWG